MLVMTYYLYQSRFLAAILIYHWTSTPAKESVCMRLPMADVSVYMTHACAKVTSGRTITSSKLYSSMYVSEVLHDDCKYRYMTYSTYVGSPKVQNIDM